MKWDTKPLEEVCTFKNGLWKGKKRPLVPCSVIRNTNFGINGTLDAADVARIEVQPNQLATRRLQPGDILLEKSGGGPKQPVGRVMLFELDAEEAEGEAYSLSNFMTVLRIRDGIKVLPAFLHKFLHWIHLSGRTKAMQRRSTGIRNLQLKNYKLLPIPVLPLPEQRRIAATINTASTAADRAAVNAQANLEAANEITAAQAERAIDRHLAHYPVSTLEQLIADGLIELGRGKVISKKDLAATPGVYPVYSSAKMNDGKFGEYGLYMFNEELITWSVDGGGKLFHRPRHRFSVTNVGGTLRILAPDVLHCRYLYYALTVLHRRVDFNWVRKAHPSVIRKLYNDIPVPPLNVQKAVVQELDEVAGAAAALAAAYDRKLVLLDELKASLLDAAFAGRL